MSGLDPSLATLAELRGSLGLTPPDPARVEWRAAEVGAMPAWSFGPDSPKKTTP